MILGRCRAGPTPRPAAGDFVFLANTGFVAEPDLYGAGLDTVLLRNFVQAGRESFLKKLNGACGLCVVAWPGRELAIPHGAQLPAERLLGDADAELFLDPLAEIDNPPADDAMDARNRAALQDRLQCSAVRVVQQ